MIQENKVSFELRMFKVDWPIKSVDAEPCHKDKSAASMPGELGWAFDTTA